jgi:hypothetical protein
MPCLSFRDFLDFAQGFRSNAESAAAQGHERLATSYIIASILLSWISIESFVNNMFEDFAALPQDIFTVHERGFLLERAVEFSVAGETAGEFCLTNRTDYKRLEDKILFLVGKFGGGTKLDKGGPLWQKFEAVKQNRNLLSHPRRGQELNLSLDAASDALQVAQAVIDVLAEKVWGKPVHW